MFFIRRHGKQTPYRYSADATEIIRNTHDFCKREKEDGLKISVNQVKERASKSNRAQQKYDRAGNATRKCDITETTAYQGPVVYIIVSLTTSLRRQLNK